MARCDIGPQKFRQNRYPERAGRERIAAFSTSLYLMEYI
jgi:hypothetical protein